MGVRGAAQETPLLEARGGSAIGGQNKTKTNPKENRDYTTNSSGRGGCGWAVATRSAPKTSGELSWTRSQSLTQWSIRPPPPPLRLLTQLTPATCARKAFVKHSHTLLAHAVPPQLADAHLLESARPQSCRSCRRNLSPQNASATPASPALCPQPCCRETPAPPKTAPNARASVRQQFTRSRPAGSAPLSSSAAARNAGRGPVRMT